MTKEKLKFPLPCANTVKFFLEAYTHIHVTGKVCGN